MAGKDVWVFGYASLMWRPGFEYQDIQPAQLFGYHRALCVYSYIYRGTRENPGLVAGLLPGGSCRGMAIKVAASNWDRVHDYLLEREMVYNVYIPKWMKGRVNGKIIPMYGFVANPDHEQFAGHLSNQKAAELIAHGHGQEGSGLEYLTNTIDHLGELGIKDRVLSQIYELALNSPSG